MTLLGPTAAAVAEAGAPEDGQSLRSCRSKPGLGLFVSPREPVAGQPLRVLVVSERPQQNVALVALGPSGKQTLPVQSGGGPPYFWSGTLESPQAGLHRFALTGERGEPVACGRRRVEPRRPRARPVGPEQWPVTAGWSRYHENLYSAWLEKLFDAPVGQQPSWTPLHKVLRDPSRNLLYNHLGTDEDGPDAGAAVVLQPDCADLPYFLRAYFSWKLGLPFGYRHCDRGDSTRPSRCEAELRTNLSSSAAATGTAALRFSRFLRNEVSLVHSGSGRTGPDDDQTDLYPVPLRRETLRPGTVYVDPYGHLLVVARWVSQTADRGGILYAIDGHPDLSVGRKRFWRGAFLFSDRIQGGAGGFKAFRPLVRRGSQLVALTNSEINANPDYHNHSAEQYKLGVDGFYERMDSVISPRPLPPLQAYRELLEALHELVLERVGSVQVGEDYLRKTSYAEIPMPRGPRIFETKGAWEDYSTPARDLRLLIAIEEVLRFPGFMLERPSRFAIPQGDTPATSRQRLEELLKDFTREKGFSYNRSDGSSWKVTLAQVIERRKGLEIAYNPNDCAEVRWAAEGDELSTCKRRAPAAQRQLMDKYRVWFSTRTRPPLR